MIHDWLKPYCTRTRSRAILDEISSNFYLEFDCDEAEGFPETVGTCDILVCQLDLDGGARIPVVSNANEEAVKQFLRAISHNHDYPERLTALLEYKP